MITMKCKKCGELFLPRKVTWGESNETPVSKDKVCPDCAAKIMEHRIENYTMTPPKSYADRMADGFDMINSASDDMGTDSHGKEKRRPD